MDEWKVRENNLVQNKEHRLPERGKQDVGGCTVEMAGNYQFLSQLW